MNLARSFILLFILLSQSFAASAYTPVLVERLPTEYNDFWSSWWIPQVYALDRLLSELERLHLEEVNASEPRLVLSSEEWKEFSEAIGKYSEARKKAAEATVWARDARSYYTASYAFILNSMFVVQYKDVLPRIQTSFALSREALTLSTEATNIAMARLLEKASELEYMGAGYAGYSGV